MSRTNPQSGFSLTDLIMGMSILAIALVGIRSAQLNYIQMTSKAEMNLRAVSLGNSVMNLIRMHRYDENSSAPWDNSLGPDGGEGSSSDYDDIDDYAGAAWDFSSDGFGQFTINTRVFNVDVPDNWLDSVGPGGDFKRIIVTVNNEIMDTPVILSSIMTG